MNKSKTVWVLEYAPEYDQTHVNPLSELMAHPIDRDWMIMGFYENIHEACDAEPKIMKFAMQNRNDFHGVPGFIQAWNKKQIQNHLKDEAKNLAATLKENPSPETLEEIMGLQRKRLSMVRDPS